MSTLIGKRGEVRLSAVTQRTILDSIATRLDETRDTSRYLVGLLVFLGLLGTFWGLIGTIGAISNVIQSLDPSAGDSNDILGSLKAGLTAPLAGMGTAFSSSLLGLSGSLILGFLDLQAGRAQNRFYTQLENWLSSVTDTTDAPKVPRRRRGRGEHRAFARGHDQSCRRHSGSGQEHAQRTADVARLDRGATGGIQIAPPHARPAFGAD